MIRFELKDKSRQEAFEKALPGFKEECQRACERHDGHLDEGMSVVFSHTKLATDSWTSNEWSLVIPANNLEVIGKYDSKKWNKYPEVTPPEGVWMRVEGNRAKDFHVKCGAIFLRGEWYWRIPRASDPYPACAQMDGREVERFRPWEDEECQI